MYPKMRSIDIFDNLQLVGWNLKVGLFDPPVSGLWGRMGLFDNSPVGSY